MVQPLLFFFGSGKPRALSLLLALFLVLTGSVARAQAPAWQTAIACGQGPDSYSAVSVTATDASGNVFVAGSFSGTASFGGINLTSVGSNDVFIAKWNTSSGSFVWARRAGGMSDDYATALVVSGTSVYVAGDFQGPTADFGGTSLISIGGGPINYKYDAFVTKLTDAGSSATFEWAQRAGGTEDDFATSLAVSGTSVYVAGYFESATANFGGTTLTKINPRGNDVFLTKLTDASSSAGFTWTQQASGRIIDGAASVAASGTSVYLVGAFFNSTSLGSTTLTSAGSNIYSDIFVARLTDLGSTSSFVWARRAGGISEDQPLAVAVSGTNVYVAGVFTGPASFGSLNLSASAADDGDAFVTKLTDAGDFVWAQRAGGTELDFANSLVVSGTSVYAAGNFESTAAGFGGTTLTNAKANLADLFVARLTDAGSSASFVWAQQAVSGGETNVSSLALSGTSLYVGGVVAPPASFGNLSIARSAGSATDNYVGFLASLPATAGTPLATNSPALSARLSLYPNPARTRATIQLPAVPGTTQATLTLRDALGRAVRTQHLPLPTTGTTTEVSLRGLAPGLYHLQVQAGPHHATRQLAVE